jgi:hypothetical protein
MIRQTTESELESLHIETFINTTPGVTKVSDQSVLRGIIRGNVRTAKKALKDMMLAVSRLFPDLAYDTTLDQVADDRGISTRLAAAQSSTYVRLIADPATIYQQGIHVVSDNKGNSFDLEGDLTVGSKGYGYVKVRSQQSGSFTNVDPYTIINIAPQPSGHLGVLNEYASTGGRDVEDDSTFRQRIKEGPDILARGTLSYLTQAFIKINSNVLRVIYEGTNSQGKVVLGILTVNGIDLTVDELQTLLEQAGPYLSLTELSPIGTQSYGISLKNVEYHYVDISMRIELFVGSNFDDVVKDIQQKFSKYVDFRTWDSSIDKVEWDVLLGIVRSTSGVKYVSDNSFVPNVDVTIQTNKFPRFRGFVVYNLAGAIQVNQSGTIDPIFYPNEVSTNLTVSVL